MKKTVKTFGRTIKHIALPATIAIAFVVLAGRIAFTSATLLPYDEAFHLGLIRLYTQHLNPFLASQPAGGDAFGAVARDPSYLYHYLMSFPMRAIEHFVSDPTAQVFILRGLNIALGLATLYLVYRLARRLGLSRLGAQLASLCLALTPVFYDVSAQINYDNLFIPLVLLSVLGGMSVAEKFRRKEVPLVQLGLLTTLVLLASLVKFTYLPVALGLGVYLAVVAVRSFGIRSLPSYFAAGFRSAGLASMVLVTALVAIGSVCWVQRYGVNIAAYHNPTPDCKVVLDTTACSHYGIWARNTALAETASSRPFDGLQLRTFTMLWLHNMSTQVFSTVHLDNADARFDTIYQAKLFAKVAIGIGLAGAVLAMSRFVKRKQVWVAAAVVSVTYVAVLWEHNFAAYHTLHMALGIQGRYLLPVLPVLYVATVIGYEAMFSKVADFRITKLQTAFSNAVLVGLMAAHRLQRLGRLAVEGPARKPAGSDYMQYESFRSLAT